MMNVKCFPIRFLRNTTPLASMIISFQCFTSLPSPCLPVPLIGNRTPFPSWITRAITFFTPANSRALSGTIFGFMYFRWHPLKHFPTRIARHYLLFPSFNSGSRGGTFPTTIFSMSFGSVIKKNIITRWKGTRKAISTFMYIQSHETIINKIINKVKLKDCSLWLNITKKKTSQKT